MSKEKVAFVIHPSDLGLLIKGVREMKPEKKYAPELMLKFFEWVEPFKHKEFTGLSFDGKKKVDGAMFMVPFLPEMKDHALSKVIAMVEKTLDMARREGCTVAAMAGFTSIVIQGLEAELSRKYNIRITSGNTTTAAVIVRSVEDLCKKFKVKLNDSNLAIIGASGDIGYGCFLYFAEKVNKLWLTARGLAALENRVAPALGFLDGDIELTTDNAKAVKASNIVICVTSAYSTIFDLKDFSPGTIVCDASAPENVETHGKLRPDVFLYHGGIAALPFEVDFGLNAGLASTKHLHGCQTEGILNALDPEIPCSVGRGNISQYRIEDIIKRMDKAFRFAPAYSIGAKHYTEEELGGYAAHLKNKIAGKRSTSAV